MEANLRLRGGIQISSNVWLRLVSFLFFFVSFFLFARMSSKHAT